MTPSWGLKLLITRIFLDLYDVSIAVAGETDTKHHVTVVEYIEKES